MALLADQSADANSNITAGAPSQSKRFTMPGNVAIKVESVVATITNGAASAVTPELTIKDQSGVVIGTQRQDSSIPAGDTGTATYALRLNGNFGTAAGFIRYGVVNVGNWLEIQTTTNLAPDTGGVNFQVGSGGFEIVANNPANGEFHVDTSFVFFKVNGGIYRFTDASLFDVAADATVIIGETIDLEASSAVPNAINTNGNVGMNLAVGQALTVFDHLGNPIFRVDEDGDLHGLTGKALTFDL